MVLNQTSFLLYTSVLFSCNIPKSEGFFAKGTFPMLTFRLGLHKHVTSFLQRFIVLSKVEGSVGNYSHEGYTHAAS